MRTRSSASGKTLGDVFNSLQRSPFPHIPHDVTCPFFGCEFIPIRAIVNDYCDRCSVIDDCEELALAPSKIRQITELSQLPPYLTSKFELVRLCAIHRFEELLQGE
jgi:hypothetical protein